MITSNELRSFVEQFGVPDEQVARDHLISHLLVALARVASEPFVFFGGTALCRTHLLDWRLSEDVDLLVDEPGSWEQELTAGLPRELRREYPDLEFSWTQEGTTRVAQGSAGGMSVKIQLVERDDGYRRYPVERLPVHLRYSDLPDTLELAVPTPIGATAMKLAAWVDRSAPRDLADLCGLATHGHISKEAVELAHEISRALVPQAFAPPAAPDEDVWYAALAAQMPEVPPRAEALEVVREAVSDVAGWWPEDHARSSW